MPRCRGRPGSTGSTGPTSTSSRCLPGCVDDGFAANRHVHYPRNHGRVAHRIAFRATSTGAGAVVVQVAGRADVALRDGVRAHPVDGGLELGFTGPGAAVELTVRRGRLRTRDRRPLWRDPRGLDGEHRGRTVARGPPRPGGERPPHLDPPGSVDVVARPGPGGVLDGGAGPRTSGPARPGASPRSRAARASRRRWPTSGCSRPVTTSCRFRRAAGPRAIRSASGTCGSRMARRRRSRCERRSSPSPAPARSRAPTSASPGSGRRRSTPSGCATRD